MLILYSIPLHLLVVDTEAVRLLLTGMLAGQVAELPQKAKLLELEQEGKAMLAEQETQQRGLAAAAVVAHLELGQQGQHQDLRLVALELLVLSLVVL